MYRLLVLSGLILLTQVAYGSGSFDNSDRLAVVYLGGTLFVHCPSDQASVPCSKYIVEPVSESYFRDSEFADADRVQLKAVHGDRTVETKEEKYLAVEKRSAKVINLLASGWFNKPLLSEGLNHIQYTLFKESAVVRAGSFDINVQSTERRCDSGDTFENTNGNCRNPILLCEDYFLRQNDCR